MAGLPAIHRYRDPEYLTRTTLSTAVPIKNDQGVIGAVILRQSGEEYLSLTDQAFSKLLGYSVLAVGIGAFGLLAYASNTPNEVAAFGLNWPPEQGSGKRDQ